MQNTYALMQAHLMRALIGQRGSVAKWCSKKHEAKNLFDCVQKDCFMESCWYVHTFGVSFCRGKRAQMEGMVQALYRTK